MTLTNSDMLIRIDERLKLMNEKIDDIYKVIHGNGREGLCDKVIKNENNIKNLFKKHEKDSKYRLTVTTVGLTIIGILIAVTNYLW